MRIEAAIIGGTGVGDRLAALPGASVAIATREGLVRGRRVVLSGKSVLAIQRHSAGHRTPPHRVRYAAFALALQELGIARCFATAAVGSLRPEWGIGTMGPCTGFLDASSRNITLFEDRVEHRDFTKPFGGRAPLLPSALASCGLSFVQPVVYLQANGPRYETPDEIRTYRGWGADVVGMTAASEAIVMREANVVYECLAFVTNLAAGLAPGELHHGEVGDAMRSSGETVMRVLETAVGVIG